MDVSLGRDAASVIRDAVLSDLETIVGIYNASIPGRLATADTEPVSIESRREWFQDHDSARHPLWVLERQGRVVGWLSLSKFYGRPAYAATAEVGVYVDPAAQRGGVATRLMQHAFDRAPGLRLDNLLAFVFAHNERSISLFSEFGFERWGHLPKIAVLDGIERDLVILGRRLRATERSGPPVVGT
jgi:L-amino acid N-acyltransferase YncA